ncbi:MAG: bifunctional folylpolyglutamate synthase/dihydrofolate synthase, partial [Clostridiales bacterium]|nr:bifunctional folylpolyglutamate synthase/dihydrofolate synthase [Clostridiales bacterium]
GSVLGLDSIKILMSELGNPQNDLKFIHIAGTNGKGSILAMLSGILEKAGYRVGRYVSPTVMGYEERFQVNREWINEEELAFLVSEVRDAAKRVYEKHQISPTVFEIETAIAFLFFKQKNCDYVVLETGLGGLTDATNIVTTTELCIFASISMDHMGFLGNTIEEIAATKAGIIKEGAGIVTSKQTAEVWDILEAKAKPLGCNIVMAEPSEAVIEKESLDGQIFSYKEYESIKLGLLGRYQIDNAVTVLEAIKRLNQRGLNISMKAARDGLSEASWPGRFQIIGKDLLVFVDGAHNEDAVRRLGENIGIYLQDKKVHAIMGVFKDKNYKKMLEIIAPYVEDIVAIDLPNSDRTLDKEILRDAAEQTGVATQTADSIDKALELVKLKAADGGVVVAFGSLSYLGDVISINKS